MRPVLLMRDAIFFDSCSRSSTIRSELFYSGLNEVGREIKGWTGVKLIDLVGNWNAILDPKIDKVGRGARGLDRCGTSLIDFMARHNLVNRFGLDHPGREMWTWIDTSLFVCVRSYWDRVLVRRADSDCFLFH